MGRYAARPSSHTVRWSQIVKASPWRITMPTISPQGTHDRTHVLHAIWARQIWLPGPSPACWKAFAGMRFSCVPHPISAGAMPSS